VFLVAVAYSSPVLLVPYFNCQLSYLLFYASCYWAGAKRLSGWVCCQLRGLSLALFFVGSFGGYLHQCHGRVFVLWILSFTLTFAHSVGY
jgi:hypothetical protein